jgi:uncharacterized membrane protein YfcA
MPQLDSLHWGLAIVGGMLIGLSKTGIAGLGLLAALVFAFAFPPSASVGIVLPILICGDIIAVVSYRKHAVWSTLIRLFPWAAAGVLIAYFSLQHIHNNHDISRLIGALCIVLAIAQIIWRSLSRGKDASKLLPRQIWFPIAMGLLGGFATMTANAAGPIMVLYLLAMGLPKMEFVGTTAWYFFIVNCFKVPFSCSLGQITPHSLIISALFVPAMLIGAWTGRKILPKINQSAFEDIALALTMAAGIKLLF